MNALRELTWWSSQRLAPLAAALGDTLADWAQDWGFECVAPTVRNAFEALHFDAAGPAPASWQALRDAAGTTLWLGSDDDAQTSLARALTGTASTHDPLTRELAARAVEDMARRMAALFDLSADTRWVQTCPPPAEDARAWSGAVRVGLVVGPARLWWHVPAACVRPRVAPAAARSDEPAVLPIEQGVGIALRAMLKPIALSAAQWCDLHVGDVIATDHALAAPLVFAAGAQPLFSGWLGENQQARALMLTDPHPSLHEQETTMTDTTSTVAPLSLQPLPASAQAGATLASAQATLDALAVVVRVSVGEASLTLGQLRAAKANQLIRLDRSVDAPVDVMIDNRVVARGKLVACDDCFAVQLTELPRSEGASA